MQNQAALNSGIPPANFSPPSILRIREVQARTGLARPTLYKLIQQNRFPSGVDLLGTGRAVGWEEQAVTNWINERITASKKPTASSESR